MNQIFNAADSRARTMCITCKLSRLNAFVAALPQHLRCDALQSAVEDAIAARGVRIEPTSHPTISVAILRNLVSGNNSVNVEVPELAMVRGDYEVVLRIDAEAARSAEWAVDGAARRGVIDRLADRIVALPGRVEFVEISHFYAPPSAFLLSVRVRKTQAA